MQNPKAQGILNISEDAVEKIALKATYDVDGVDTVGTGKKLSVAKLAGFFLKDNSKINLSKISGGALEISLSVILKPAFNAEKVAKDIQFSVKQAVQSMTGIAVSKVNVKIAGLAV
jgi:uncharacterized alkaline shock family protein YloU